jgi:hypothetical protein
LTAAAKKKIDEESAKRDTTGEEFSVAKMTDWRRELPIVSGA